MTQTHISRFDIPSAVATRMQALSVEIKQFEQDGIEIPLTAQDLFNLEALGLVYDFQTQMVTCESEVELANMVATAVVTE